MEGKGFLCMVGLNCLDIVSFVPKYPREDGDIRCTRQVWARGGNDSNNATVLACLGQPVEFLGTLANDHLLQFFKDDMNKLGIKFDHCPIIEGIARAPASVVLCSEETGSRTIVHCKGDLPELTLHDFERNIDLEKYSWVHFEGRNEEVVVKMMEKIHQFNDKGKSEDDCDSQEESMQYRKVGVPISVEIEKCRDPLNMLIPLAHVVFIGKDFATLQGAKDCRDAVRIMTQRVSKGVVVICPWGEDGAAFGVSSGSGIEVIATKIDAFPPTTLIDSLGAGDTFLATTLYCLNKKMDVESSIRMGCRIASEKIGIYGFLRLKDKAHILSEEIEKAGKEKTLSK